LYATEQVKQDRKRVFFAQIHQLLDLERRKVAERQSVLFGIQACLRPRDRFWDIPVPKIDSAFDNLLVPQPSWSPSTTQQLRKLVAAPYLAPI
ncbi:hypothetical protein, partial [Thiolapillus sp.]|uniref:hypothetical protein n=1 Tax=Thiolapillus sp. TaxID=2017437 RepID=UPI003AF9A3F5